MGNYSHIGADCRYIFFTGVMSDYQELLDQQSDMIERLIFNE